VKPYVDDGCVRTFNANVNHGDLVWHRDKEDREITVLSGSGWKFQFDNQLPFDIEEGMCFFVPCMTYHRIIRGETNLTISIQRVWQ
jgi:quercetin dioxygenase-like cupin family protein